MTKGTDPYAVFTQASEWETEAIPMLKTYTSQSPGDWKDEQLKAFEDVMDARNIPKDTSTTTKKKNGVLRTKTTTHTHFECGGYFFDDFFDERQC